MKELIPYIFIVALRLDITGHSVPIPRVSPFSRLRFGFRYQANLNPFHISILLLNCIINMGENMAKKVSFLNGRDIKRGGKGLVIKEKITF